MGDPNKGCYFGLSFALTAVRHLPWWHQGDSYDSTSLSDDVDFSSSMLS